MELLRQSWELVLLGTTPKDVDQPVSLGHPVIDDYLRFVYARARRNTLLAVAYDLKVFFSFQRKEPSEITTSDVFSFIA